MRIKESEKVCCTEMKERERGAFEKEKIVLGIENDIYLQTNFKS
jgi:hypothetical protein